MRWDQEVARNESLAGCEFLGKNGWRTSQCGVDATSRSVKLDGYPIDNPHVISSHRPISRVVEAGQAFAQENLHFWRRDKTLKPT